jgi:hypothetical protein
MVLKGAVAIGGYIHGRPCFYSSRPPKIARAYLLPLLLALASTWRIANPIAIVIKVISHASRGGYFIRQAIAFIVIDPISGIKVIWTVVEVIRAVGEVVGTVIKVIGAVLKVVD